jgi:hypothetical protein
VLIQIELLGRKTIFSKCKCICKLLHGNYCRPILKSSENLLPRKPSQQNHQRHRINQSAMGTTTPTANSARSRSLRIPSPRNARSNERHANKYLGVLMKFPAENIFQKRQSASQSSCECVPILFLLLLFSHHSLNNVPPHA